MKSLLRGDRATSAVPVSLAARLAAWAKESLAARGFAVGVGLVVLAVIGRSALAGSSVTSSTSPAAPTASAVAVPAVIQAAAPVEAGSPVSALPSVASVAIEELPATPAPSVATRARATPEDPVDLNTATVTDLRRLPGVGAKRAEAILALRARLPGGRFRQIEDLLKVKGVGRAMLKRLGPLVRLTP